MPIHPPTGLSGSLSLAIMLLICCPNLDYAFRCLLPLRKDNSWKK
uniref:Uncharacterized protein n=1 Tax=Rhizophora mucronata TaxID=61149 RepID=A0A2P2IME9_RHIMU